MWQVLWLSPPPEQARAICWSLWTKASRRRFFELVPSQGRISKNSNVNNFLSSCFAFLIRAFSKIRILSWETCYLASISIPSSPFQTKSCDHFDYLHKPRLLTYFHDNPASPVKVVPKWKSLFCCRECSSHSLALPGILFKIHRS